MKKHFIKRASIIAITLCLITVSAFVCSQLMKKHYETRTFPITVSLDSLDKDYAEASYIFDPNDTEKMAAATDYIFVGYLDKIIGTTYEDVEVLDGKWIGTPFTHFSVINLYNIKGNLQTKEPLPVLMFGGVNINNKSLLLLESNSMPYEEHYYIFMVGANEKDELYINAQCDLGKKINKEEVAAYFDAWRSQEKYTPSESASPEIQTINAYVTAFENRDLNYEKKKQFHSSYEAD